MFIFICDCRIFRSYLTVLAGVVQLNHTVADMLDQNNTYTVEDILIHPEYNNRFKISDIALLKLSEELFLSDSINYIDLYLDKIDCFKSVTLVGWGLASPRRTAAFTLQYIEVRTVSSETCRYLNGACEARGVCRVDQHSHMCTLANVNQGACAGEVGNPLIYRNKLAAIWSWSDCCQPLFPDVYTIITEFEPWIKRHVQ